MEAGPWIESLQEHCQAQIAASDMAHLWDNVALWVALSQVKAWQDLQASKQRNSNG